jgi:hypothetical protein
MKKQRKHYTRRSPFCGGIWWKECQNGQYLSQNPHLFAVCAVPGVGKSLHVSVARSVTFVQAKAGAPSGVAVLL